MSATDACDRPHEPTADDLWQESDCYWFFDRESGIGGYHRIGQHPNRGKGNVLLNLFNLGSTRFRLICDYAAADCLRDTDGQKVGSSTARSLGDARMVYAWDEPDCSGELTFTEPFYDPRDWVVSSQADEGAVSVKSAMNTGGHLECSGRISGKVRIGDRSWDICALAHRDRSWGARDYRAAFQHRMISGTMGPELSWATYVMRLENGIVAHAGFVVREGKSIDVTKVDAIAEFADDGLSVPRMRARLQLADGSELLLDGVTREGFCAQTEGWLLSTHSYIALGEEGFTIFDATNRPSKGGFIPGPHDVIATCASDGLSPCGDFESLRF